MTREGSGISVLLARHDDDDDDDTSQRYHVMQSNKVYIYFMCLFRPISGG